MLAVGWLGGNGRVIRVLRYREVVVCLIHGAWLFRGKIDSNVPRITARPPPPIGKG